MKKTSPVWFFFLSVVISFNTRLVFGSHLTQSPRQAPSAEERQKEYERRRAEENPSYKALPSGSYPLIGLSKGLVLYSLSSNPQVWCGATVEMFITTKETDGFEKYPDSLEYLFRNAWGKSKFFCKGQTTRINVRMFAEGREVRRGWLDEGNRFGGYVFHEEFAASLSPNPAQETLATTGLEFQPTYDNLFYGRFDRVRAERMGELIFVRTYLSFLKDYGDRHEGFLQSPTTTYPHFEAWKGAFGRIETKRIDYKIEKRFEPSLRVYLEKVGIGGIMGAQIDADITKLVSRHQGNSKALRQFLENLYRFANDQPSTQQTSQVDRNNVNPSHYPQTQQSLQNEGANLTTPRSPQPRTRPREGVINPSIVGIWEEKIETPSRSVSTFIFKQEGGNYTGSTTLGSRPLALRDISVVGDQVTAKASTTIPAGSINLSYKLTLAGDKLVGQGTYQFNEQKNIFYVNLKRISANPNER